MTKRNKIKLKSIQVLWYIIACCGKLIEKI